jgi:hypothetical protein
VFFGWSRRALSIGGALGPFRSLFTLSVFFAEIVADNLIKPLTGLLFKSSVSLLRLRAHE